MVEDSEEGSLEVLLVAVRHGDAAHNRMSKLKHSKAAKAEPSVLLEDTLKPCDFM